MGIKNEIIELTECLSGDPELRGLLEQSLREMAEDASLRAPDEPLTESHEPTTEGRSEVLAEGLAPMKENFSRFMDEILGDEDTRAKSRETLGSDTPGMVYVKRYGELAQNRIVWRR